MCVRHSVSQSHRARGSPGVWCALCDRAIESGEVLWVQGRLQGFPVYVLWQEGSLCGWWCWIMQFSGWMHVWGYVLMVCTGVFFLSKCYRKLYFCVTSSATIVFPSAHSCVQCDNDCHFFSRDCGSVKGTCEDEASIIYAWARNAPPTKLPRGIVYLMPSSICTSSHEY